MINILAATKHKQSLEALRAGLEEQGGRITWARSCGDIFSMLKEKSFDLIITDEKLSDTTGPDCIKKLIAFNPMLNCAAISSLAPEVFHARTEGLGVLMQLPVVCGKKEAKQLMDHLKAILQLTDKVDG